MDFQILLGFYVFNNAKTQKLELELELKKAKYSEMFI